MKKIRRLLLVLLVVLLSVPAKAGVGYLVVSERNGTTTYFALSGKPVVRTSGGQVAVTAPESNISVAIADVKDITFSNEVPTSIGKIVVSQPSFLGNGSVLFSGLNPGDKVFVYTTAGATANSATATTDGTCSLDLKQLPRGVYIIRTPNASYKVTNK